MKNTKSRNKLIAIGLIAVALVLLGVLIYKERPDNKSNSGEVESSTQQTETKKNNSNNNTSDISKSEAEKIATDKYGGTVKETEGDDYKGSPVWEVEINDSSQGRIEVKVDKKTGEILDVERD